VNYEFRDRWMVLPDNRLLMRFDNRSYRFDGSKSASSFESKDPYDALNIEMHLNVVYTVGEPKQ
jgi:hypothetical protein